MARLLLAALPAIQHTNALISIGQALGSRGHEVAFLAFPATRALLQAEGFATFDSPVLKQPGPDAVTAGLRSLLAGYGRDIAWCARKWGASAVVTDIAFQAAGLGAERAGLPWAGVYTEGLPFPGQSVPPPGSGLPIDEEWGWRGHLAAVRQTLAQWREEGRLRAARKALRLDAGAWPLSGRLSPWLTLALTTEVIEAPRFPLPETMFLVGPCRPRPAVAETQVPLEQLRTDVARVYVSMAAVFQKQPEFFAKVIQALATLPVQIILDIGPGTPGGRSAGMPPNVVALRGVSPAAVLPRVDLLLCDGAHETVTAALSLGKPMLIAPTGGLQADNAARVAYLGAGIRVDPRRARRSELRGTVARLLTEPGCRARARALSQSLAFTDGASLAGELIDRLVRTGEPVRRPAGCGASLFRDSARPWERRDLLVVR